jgi:hypothetical protein
MSLNDDILNPDSNSQAIEADEEDYYTPQPSEDSGVVTTEPDIIRIGRKLRKDVLRDMQKEEG